MLFGTTGKKLIQENSVEVERVGKLVVSSDISNIHFSQHDEKRVHIILETYEKGPQLEVNMMNERLEISAKFVDRLRWITVSKPFSSALTIYLPTDFADTYQIKSGAGNMKLSDLEMQHVELITGAGNTTIKRVQADSLTIETGAGNIKLNDIVSHKLFAQSGAGNIHGRDCTGELTVKSGAGNINFYVDGEDDLSFKSGAGNISLYFVDFFKLNGHFEVNAGLGRVNSELPLDFENKNKISSVLGEGDRYYRFKTGVGNINFYVAKQE